MDEITYKSLLSDPRINNGFWLSESAFHFYAVTNVTGMLAELCQMATQISDTPFLDRVCVPRCDILGLESKQILEHLCCGASSQHGCDGFCPVKCSTYCWRYPCLDATYVLCSVC